jgi:hypothetical protein
MRDLARKIAMSRRERESSYGLGCLFVILSALIFITVNDSAQTEAADLYFRGLKRGAILVRFAPLLPLITWLLVFYLPIGKRLPLVGLRAIRRIPVLYRCLILWAAWILLGILLGICLSPK